MNFETKKRVCVKSKPELTFLFNFLENCKEILSDWERGFLTSAFGYYLSVGLSRKQLRCLMIINNKASKIFVLRNENSFAEV